jgi:hypothetical protein
LNFFDILEKAKSNPNVLISKLSRDLVKGDGKLNPDNIQVNLLS